jgi:hypothetical protein
MKMADLWQVVAKHPIGKPRKFATPADLWAACLEYFQWTEDNPLQAAELVKYQGEAKLSNVPKMRAMTMTGLYLFINCPKQTWHEYKKRDREGDDYSDVITRVEQIIYRQKLEGAAADMLNPNIIARELGLSEKTEQKSTIQIVSMTEDEENL